MLGYLLAEGSDTIACLHKDVPESRSRFREDEV